MKATKFGTKLLKGQLGLNVHLAGTAQIKGNCQVKAELILVVLYWVT